MMPWPSGLEAMCTVVGEHARESTETRAEQRMAKCGAVPPERAELQLPLFVNAVLFSLSYSVIQDPRLARAWFYLHPVRAW
jgi:hypothetical protein